MIGLVPLLFLVLPLFIVIPMSFINGHIIEFPPHEWGLDAYRHVLTSISWGTAILYSVKVALLSVVVTSITAGLAAVGASRLPYKFEATLSALILVPLSMPVIVLALSTFQIFNNWGISGTTTAFVIAYGVLGAPYVFVVVRAALVKLDVKLIQSATSLGAGTWSLLRWVYIPSLRPAIATGALLVFAVSFDEVVVALFISGPDSITFPVKLFNETQFNLTPDIMAVATIVLVVVIALVSIAVAGVGARRVLSRVTTVESDNTH